MEKECEKGHTCIYYSSVGMSKREGPGTEVVRNSLCVQYILPRVSGIDDDDDLRRQDSFRASRKIRSHKRLKKIKSV